MKVLVGSKNRLNFTIDKYIPNIVLFVEPQEYEMYKKSRPNLEIVQLKKNNGGFGYMMNSMVEYTLENGEDIFLFADDDIFGMKRKDNQPFNVDEFLKEGEEMIRKNKFSQLGVSFSGHNWYYHKDLKLKQPVWCMGFMNAKDIKSVGGYSENLLIFNDYEISARLLMSGRTNATWYKYMFVHKMKSMDGGASYLYNQPDLIKEQCEILKKRYGSACKIIYNKTHQLSEIRFNWNKF